MNYYYSSESSHPASRWRDSNYPLNSHPDFRYRRDSGGDKWSGSVEQHSRNIIEQIARERSLSPDRRPPAGRLTSSFRQYSPTPSPPPRPVPPMKPLRSVGRTSPAPPLHSSSIITIPSRSTLASDHDLRHVGSRHRTDSDLASTLPVSSYQHEDRPLTHSSGGDSSRSANNVIRLSVSGDHHSANKNNYSYNIAGKGSHPSAADCNRRYYGTSVSPQRDQSSRRAPESPIRLSAWRKDRESDSFDRRSLSSSPERSVYHHIVREEHPDYPRKETNHWDRNTKYDKESARYERELLDNNYEQYDSDLPGHRTNVYNNNNRSNSNIQDINNVSDWDGRNRPDAPDKKRKIRIKFTYDDTNDEPSDIRLSKYKEYQGTNGSHIPRISESNGKYSRGAGRSPERHSRVSFGDESPHRAPQGKNWSSYLQEEDREKRDEDQAIKNRRRFRRNGGEGGSSPAGRSPSPRPHQPLRPHRSAEETSHADDQVQTGGSIRDVGGYRVYKMDLPDSGAPSPEQSAAPKKKNWLSSTLSRLDLRSRKARRSKSPSRQRGSSETRSGASLKPSSITTDDNDRSRELSLTRNGRNYVYVSGETRAECGRGRQRDSAAPADQHQRRLQRYSQREEHYPAPSDDSRLTRSDSEKAFGSNGHRSKPNMSQSTMELSDPKFRQRGRRQTAFVGSGSGSSGPQPGRRQLHSVSLENVNSVDSSRLRLGERVHPRLTDDARASSAVSRATRTRKDSARVSYPRSTSSRDLSDSSFRGARDDSPAVPIRHSAAASNNAAIKLHNTHHSNHQRGRVQPNQEREVRSNGVGRKSLERQNNEESVNRVVPPGGSGSNRSVYLHATTVADIPPPDQSDYQDNNKINNQQQHHRSRSGSRLSNDTGYVKQQQQQSDPHRLPQQQPLPNKERRRVARSFSLMGPFRPRHRTSSSSAGEINYENSTGLASGRPPRHPHRSASRSRTDRDRSSNSSHAGGSGAASATLVSSDDSSPHSRRAVSRSVSMPRGAAASAGWRRQTRR